MVHFLTGDRGRHMRLQQRCIQRGLIGMLSLIVVATIAVNLKLLKGQFDGQFDVENNQPSTAYFVSPSQEQEAGMFRRRPALAKTLKEENQSPAFTAELGRPINTSLSPLQTTLYQLGFKNVDMQMDFLKIAPSWDEITALYGSKPIIEGLETCEDFRKIKGVKSLGVAGTFNSGTNLLWVMLARNCKLRNGDGVEWQVPWGKHSPVAYRGDNLAGRNAQKLWNSTSAEYIERTMPVVIIRDPYRWMTSMCRQPYQLEFDHSKEECPNLVPTAKDIAAHPRYAKKDYMPAHVIYDRKLKKKVTHLSMLHHYNDWYGAYYNATFPRLILRLEDLYFRAEETIAEICQCVGGESRTGTAFVHERFAAKGGSSHVATAATGMVEAIIKYGNASTRAANYIPNQLEAANKIVDPVLMATFEYPYVRSAPHP